VLVGDAVAMYVDESGQKWHVCAFWKPSVLSRRAEAPSSDAEMATVVFERPGEERVALTMSFHDWDSRENLRKLFLCAAERRERRERRSGVDRRLDYVAVLTDRRVGDERRLGDPRRRHDRGAGYLFNEAGETFRKTPAEFSKEEASEIRAHAVVGSHPVCPRCAVDLMIGPLVVHGEATIRQLSCPKCLRTVMVRGMW
jgi:hypothetical protein